MAYFDSPKNRAIWNKELDGLREPDARKTDSNRKLQISSLNSRVPRDPEGDA